MTDARYWVGADENGMGPRLGPLVVTAVLARVQPEAERIVTRKPRGALGRRLGDSKGLVAHGNIALAEAWTRALVAKGCGKHGRADDPDALLDAVSFEDRDTLTEPCPRSARAQCWHLDGERFTDPELMGDTLKQVTGDLKRLERRGVEIVAVRSSVVCTQRLNDAVARGQSRFMVDLHRMEELILSLRGIAGSDLQAVCGKVGGYGQYGKAFGPLAGRLHVVLEEGRARSAYRFPGIGEIAFVRDGDATNMLVGMASLVGKYVRELMMERIVRFYRQDDDSLPTASGYHDPVTGSFIVGTEGLRRKRRIPERCFERDSLGS